MLRKLPAPCSNVNRLPRFLAARQIIVDGAVGMARMAIERLEQDASIDLDEERKVAMINNLMVTIVSDRSAQPVINTGSLY